MVALFLMDLKKETVSANFYLKKEKKIKNIFYFSNKQTLVFSLKLLIRLIIISFLKSKSKSKICRKISTSIKQKQIKRNAKHFLKSSFLKKLFCLPF